VNTEFLGLGHFELLASDIDNSVHVSLEMGCKCNA